MSFPTTHNQLYQNAVEYLLEGNYVRAASLYEQAITTEPEIKSHYWYLGLTLLLQGQEAEAQATWLMALMEGNTEQVDLWNNELAGILEAEARRREEIQEYSTAVTIRQTIREISPRNIHNLLHLVKLFIELKTYLNEDLQELGIIQILQSEAELEIDLNLLAETLKIVLNHAYFYASTLEFVDVSSSKFAHDHKALLSIILPAVCDIAYVHKRPKLAAPIAEIYSRFDPYNIEFLSQLSSIYQNMCDYDKGISTAKLLCSVVETLADKVSANRQLLRGLMMAGGYWSESFAINQNQQELLLELIQESPTNLREADVMRLFNVNFFAYYMEDNPRIYRHLQNELMQLCHLNLSVYAQTHVDKYSQGHLDRKKQGLPRKKLKIGYISYCLRTHSVGWIVRWLMQYHDRDKFEINGYFVGSSTDGCDPLQQWYFDQVDKSYNSNNVLSLAEEIYQDEVDILIDLDSVTLDISCEVMLVRPAPVQVTWLGSDAIGSQAIDYFIVDPYVLPEAAEEYYCEKIWRLPQTFVAVGGFEVSTPTIRRDQLEIPSDAVVYYCTQRAFKRIPDITRLQLRIIKEVPNSYFLNKSLADEKLMERYFYDLAKEEGVDTDRLRFISQSPTEVTHRANLSIADVVLDTYPYNGATTTLETLWMCIPLVTLVGEQFFARNTYSMMMNAGVTEGIAWTHEEYVEWGIRLGKDESLRSHIAWKLKKSRDTSPLWNGKQFAREMEKAYEQMWQIYVDSQVDG